MKGCAIGLQPDHLKTLHLEMGCIKLLFNCEDSNHHGFIVLIILMSFLCFDVELRSVALSPLFGVMDGEDT